MHTHQELTTVVNKALHFKIKGIWVDLTNFRSNVYTAQRFATFTQRNFSVPRENLWKKINIHGHRGGDGSCGCSLLVGRSPFHSGKFPERTIAGIQLEPHDCLTIQKMAIVLQQLLIKILFIQAETDRLPKFYAHVNILWYHISPCSDLIQYSYSYWCNS